MSEYKPKWLGYLGWIEGFSLILLIHVAMPLKYLAAQPIGVRIFGMLHGLFFIAYIVGLFYVGIKQRWHWTSFFMGIFLSFTPFGILIFDDYIQQRPHEKVI